RELPARALDASALARHAANQRGVVVARLGALHDAHALRGERRRAGRLLAQHQLGAVRQRHLVPGRRVGQPRRPPVAGLVVVDTRHDDWAGALPARVADAQDVRLDVDPQLRGRLLTALAHRLALADLAGDLVRLAVERGVRDGDDRPCLAVR